MDIKEKRKLEEVEGKTSQDKFMENIIDDFKFVAIHSISLFHIASRGLEINIFLIFSCTLNRSRRPNSYFCED